jgi:hypothetical protein
MEKQSRRTEERQLQSHSIKRKQCIPFRFNGKLKAKGVSKKRAGDENQLW